MKPFDVPIKVLTPLGPALSYFLVDGPGGVEWGCFIVSTGEAWFFRNPFVRLAPDATNGHGQVSPFGDIPFKLKTHIERYKKSGWIP